MVDSPSLSRPARPVWAELSLGALRGNYRALRALAPAAEVLAVVKANAYGHGVDLCAPACIRAGAHWLGVTSVEEGVRVRTLGPDPQVPPVPKTSPDLQTPTDTRILVMSGLHPGEAAAVLAHRLAPSVWEPYQLDLLAAEARQRGLPPQSVPVHLELDTGMARQGLSVPGARNELAALLPRFAAHSPLRLEGVMTHFHSPEVLEGATALQIGRLAAALELITAQGVRPELLHAGNSATLLGGSDLPALEALALRHGMGLMLRPGLALYGYAPSFVPPQAPPVALRRVLAWKTRITSLRTIQPGETVGYNATYRAAQATSLALLPVGYADGYNRLLSNRGTVLIRGERAPIAGRVSMDQVVVDVSGVSGASIGDEAVLLGEQGIHSVTADDIATLTGTISYEVLCAIGARVPRLAVG